ncbi:MAG: HAMP domain-containing sensor histidine kinase [Lachnospiraceae bacterium]
MRLWQKIYLIALLLFLPILNVGLFMGAWMVFDYNIDMAKTQSSDEINLMSHTVTQNVDALPSDERLIDNIVPTVASIYIDYISNKDANAILELKVVEPDETLQMGYQWIKMTVDKEGMPIIYVEQLLQPPYENYKLVYENPLDEFYTLWQNLKIVFFIISLGCSIILALVLYILLYELTYPLSMLTQGIKVMKFENRWEPVEVIGKDDITDLTNSFNEMGEEIENQMLQLVKETEIKQQLVDDLAHELRTPLTAIYGYAEYLEKAPHNEEERLEALDYIMNESKRLSNMGQVLLSMAIFREDKMARDEIISTEFVRDVLNTLEIVLFENRIKVIRKVQDFTFYGDRTMLVCLLRNVIENAMRASEYNRRIWITLEQQKEEVLMRVEDEGIGMRQEELAKITEAFYRVDSARSRSNGGAGIGLNLCALIVNKHMGTMEFESEEGIGTTVSITLPIEVL